MFFLINKFGIYTGKEKSIQSKTTVHDTEEESLHAEEFLYGNKKV